MTNLGTANNTTDADHDIDFSIGTTPDSTAAVMLVNTSAMTKRIDADWTEGNNGGGRASAVTLASVGAFGWFHMFIIGKTDGTVDFGFDSSLTAANLLADDATAYSYYKWIGAVQLDPVLNIISYQQDGDYFSFGPVAELIGSTTTSRSLTTISVPPGIAAIADVTVRCWSTTNDFYTVITCPDSADLAPGSTQADIYSIAGGDHSQVNLRVKTNTSRQIGRRSSVASKNIAIYTRAFEINRALIV